MCVNWWVNETVWCIYKMEYYLATNSNTVLGRWAEMKGQEDLELAASAEHTKITALYRIAIEEKDQNLPSKIFYN